MKEIALVLLLCLVVVGVMSSDASGEMVILVTSVGSLWLLWYFLKS